MTLSDMTQRLHLCEGPLRILVVEDSVGFAQRLVEFLLEMGHRVDSLLGVETIEHDQATGLQDENGEPSSLSLSGIDIAFLDHYFISSRYDGTHLAKELRKRGCPHIVAMSSDEGANRRMMKEGATLSLRKSDLARMLGNL